MASISSGEATMPSVSEKPSAKSSKSAGDAIITAWVVPAKENATGVSSGTMRFPAAMPLGRRASREIWLRGGRMRMERLLRRFQMPGNAPAFARLPIVFGLPFRRSVRRADLHRSHLVFRAVGRPV
jgi:hypothetical protein